jgi:hypothetical protein
VVILAAALSVGTAVTASDASARPAQGASCAKTAMITARHGDGTMYVLDKRHPQGKVFNGSTLRRGHAYATDGVRITLRFGGSHFKVGGDSIIKLGCSGDAVGDPAVMPSLGLLDGKIKVVTTRRSHGSVATEEGLFGVVPGTSRVLHYKVVRQASTNDITPTDVAQWYAEYAGQLDGRSVVKTTNGPDLNVTPYVGSDPGTCRAVRSAKLITHGNFGNGTARYNFG